MFETNARRQPDVHATRRCLRPVRTALAALAALAAFLSPAIVSAATLCVNPGGTGGCFATIPAAVSASFAGDVIEVQPGTYSGQIAVNKSSLTIRSTGGAAVTSIIGEGGAPGLIVICGDDNIFEGFRVDVSANTTPAHANHEEKAIRVTGDRNIIQNNVIVGRGESNGDLGVLIACGTTIGACAPISTVGCSAGDNQLRDNEVRDWFGIGILVGGSDIATGSLVLRNDVHHNFEGIYVDRANLSRISGNKVHDNDLYGIIVEGRAGRESTGTLIDRNDIYSNGAGTLFATTFDLGAGIYLKGASARAECNEIHDHNRAGNPAAGVMVTNGTGLVGAPTLTLNNFERNDFALANCTGNIGGACTFFEGIGRTSTERVEAKDNWWNAASGPSYAPQNPGGTGETVAGDLINVLPFLTRRNGAYFDCPASVVAECTGPAGTTVSYTIPTGTNPCGSPFTNIACTPPPGSTFPIGTTPVTCTALDPLGQPVSCGFEVLVRDTTPPELTGCALEPWDTKLDRPRPPRPPVSASSALSPCRARAVFRVDCGAASDRCSDFTVTAAIRTRQGDPASSCAAVEQTFAVDCDELVDLRLLEPCCPTRGPRKPRRAHSVDSRGRQIFWGEKLELKVTASDVFGNMSAPCIVDPLSTPDPSNPGRPLLCPPKAPKCPPPGNSLASPTHGARTRGGQ